MVTEIRKKCLQIEYGDKIFAIGYCRIQLLTRYIPRDHYIARNEGWACDVYLSGDIAITTGYAPIGKHVDYDFSHQYESAAEKLQQKYNDRKISIEELEKETIALWEEFVSKLKEM